MSRLGWPTHVHVYQKWIYFEKIISHVHLRTWSSSKVKCRGISCSISPLSGQYGILWTAPGERGLVSGMNTITWHVIMNISSTTTGIRLHVCYILQVKVFIQYTSSKSNILMCSPESRPVSLACLRANIYTVQQKMKKKKRKKSTMAPSNVRRDNATAYIIM